MLSLGHAEYVCNHVECKGSFCDQNHAADGCHTAFSLCQGQSQSGTASQMRRQALLLMLLPTFHMQILQMS